MSRGLGKTQRAILEWVYSEGKPIEYLAGLRAENIAREQAIIESGGEASPWWSDYNYWQEYLDRDLDWVKKGHNRDGTTVQEDYYDGVWELRRDTFERFREAKKRGDSYVMQTTKRPSFGYEPEMAHDSWRYKLETRSRSEVAAVSRALRTLKERGLIVVYPSKSISLTAEGLKLAKSYQISPA